MVPARDHNERGHQLAGRSRSATIAGNRPPLVAYVDALQRSAGNQAVSELLRVQRSPSGDLDQALGAGGKAAALEKLRVMGDMTIRLRRVTPRTVSGANSGSI